MYGEKLQQTKDAMVTILDDLSEKDHFNILVFSDEVTNWIPDAEKLLEAPHSLTHKGTKELRDEALRYVLKLNTLGGTNINDALMEALNLVTDVKIAETAVPKNTNPIIIFLTDGEPTTGVVSRPEILEKVARANEKLEVPIYGLAFGRGADFDLIKTISLKSGAYARKIFEGSDAALQLEDFYLELANPLLNNVQFSYVGEPFKNSSLTKTSFKTYFKGSEYVIAGKISESEAESESVEVVVFGEGEEGAFEKRFNLCFLRPVPLPMPIQVAAETGLLPPLPNDRPNCIFPPVIEKPEPEKSGPQNFIERLWAFLTIKNLLSEKKSEHEKRVSDLSVADDDDDESTTMTEEQTDESPTSLSTRSDVDATTTKKSKLERAKDLALKYNFVTKLTSLVVTRPGQDNVDNTTDDILVDVQPVHQQQQQQHRYGRRGHQRANARWGAPGFQNMMLSMSPKTYMGAAQRFPVSYDPSGSRPQRFD